MSFSQSHEWLIRNDLFLKNKNIKFARIFSRRRDNLLVRASSCSAFVVNKMRVQSGTYDTKNMKNISEEKRHHVVVVSPRNWFQGESDQFT
jgi:hypothetical protein